MSQLISARLPETTAERMRQYARRKQRSLNEMMATALEEWLRQNEFAYIEFRDTPDGRIAYMKGSRLSVAQVINIAQNLDNDIAEIVGYFGEHRSADWVKAALHYYEAFPVEIDAQIADIESQSFETLKRRLPQLELIIVDTSKARDVAE
jgi:single-stranded DNA-specific DHH superfamily exonuclease